jgi:hypothetical protein
MSRMIDLIPFSMSAPVRHIDGLDQITHQLLLNPNLNYGRLKPR